MKVKLIDIDSRIPNLALMKLSAYHKEKGDWVDFYKLNKTIDLGFFKNEDPDIVYISCIFAENRDKAEAIAKTYTSSKVTLGGSGISLSSKLPDEIEDIKPDYDLYPSEYSQGYTTRGCIRKCKFCVVPKKEGKIRINQHPSEFHDPGFKTCMIMDNNLFAAPESWQESVYDWFIDNKIKMLSPQGWDIRLLDQKKANYLKSIKHAGIVHFAWDNIVDEEKVLNGIEILRNVGFDLKHNISFYVLCGYNTTFDQDVYRIQKLRDLGVDCFVMPFTKTEEIKKLARGVNRKWIYWSDSFYEEFRDKKNVKWK